MDDVSKKSGTNSNQSDVEEQTELMYKDDTIWTAVFNADKDAVERIIKSNPDAINMRGVVGDCPIHMLFLYGSDAHLEIAKDLIMRYPTIVTQLYNKPMYFGENVLHIAIVKRNASMVEWLLSEEFLQPYREELLTAAATGDFFKMGEPSYYGESPLGFACCTNQWDIVEILLKYGADMATADSNGNTILHLLVICNLPDIYAKFKERWIEKYKTVGIHDVLTSKKVQRSGPWNQLNKKGLTPLTLAAHLGRVKMLSWLLYERKIVQWSYGDVSCVLHPLHQLDLEIQETENHQPLSVLEVIIKNNNPELMHPVIISLIEKKWKYFAYRKLLQRFLITFGYLLIFLVTTILEQTQMETLTDENGVNTTKPANARHIAMCSIGHCVVVLGAIWKAGYEIREMGSMGLRNYLESTGSVFLENVMSCSFCFCILIVQLFRLFDIQNEAPILAFASLIGWAYMLFFIMPLRFTGPFVIMIYKMLFNDVLRFCIIYTIFLAGFSQSFFILFNDNGFQGYLASIKQCFLGLLGDFDLDHYIESPFPFVSVTLLIVYVVVVTILLLNLLIAMMGDTYADVKKSAKKLWHLERARIALDVEKGLSSTRRNLKINKYWVEVHGERYMQIQEVNNDLFVVKNDEPEDD